MEQPRATALNYYLYIISKKAHTLYIGATDDLPKRLYEHRNRLFPESFTARYTFSRLVHFEVFATADEAFERERVLKGWKRARKVALIQATNPNWHDLSLSLPELLCLK